MKASERKYKETMPFEAVPDFLRRLADAIEKRSDPLTAERFELLDALSKLAVKGRRQADGWEMKVKLKADAPSKLPPDKKKDPGAARVPLSSTEAEIHYKDLKKRMKAAFKAIGEAAENQEWPDPNILNAFLADAESMIAFKGTQYGERHYPAFREICRKLAAAYGIQDWPSFQRWYGSLNQLKKDCHKALK